MRHLSLFATLIILITGCGKTNQLNDSFGTSVNTPIAQEFNNLFELNDLYFAGYPTETGLRAMAKQGVKVIVCAKTPEQVTNARGFDETELVKELGMKVIWIPISPSSFNTQDVSDFTQVMNKTDEPMLIHCGSSNTVGGLWAAYVHAEKGVSLDEAIAQGKSVGLRAPSMIDAVKRVSH